MTQWVRFVDTGGVLLAMGMVGLWRAGRGPTSNPTLSALLEHALAMYGLAIGGGEERKAAERRVVGIPSCS